MSGERVDITGDGGVFKTVIKQGTEERRASPGDTVSVHYTGTLASNGDKFDSSKDRNEPFSFGLAKNQVIKAWDVGVATMNIGEVALFECRADYAYGETGSPPKIPANATLNFEVELLSFEGEDISPDRDGSITKSIIAEGEKYNCPSEFAPVSVHIVGTYQRKQFLDKTLTFELGEGSEVGLPEGVDRALRRINKGEKCKVVLKGSRFTYGSNPPEGSGLPPNAELEFTIFLTDFEKVKASWEMTEEEKIEHAKTLKDKGTAFLKQNKLALAANKYSAIANLLEHTNPVGGPLKDQVDDILIAGWLNSALVNQKLNETAECIKNCEKVLEKKPTHVKALYRKGQALQQRKDLEEAIEVFTKVVELEPTNKAAQQEILVCKKTISDLRAKEKKRFAGLFEKLAKEDEKAGISIDDAREGTSSQPEEIETN